MTQMSLAFSCLSRATTKSMLNLGRTVSGTDRKNNTVAIYLSNCKNQSLQKISNGNGVIYSLRRVWSDSDNAARTSDF